MEIVTSGDNLSHIVGKSLRETVFSLAKHNQVKAIHRLKSDFKMSDRHFCWTKAAAFAERHDWIALDKFAHERKPSIGYLPFVELCLQHSAPRQELVKYISKLPDAAQRAMLFMEAGLQHEAEEASIVATHASQSFATKAAVFLEGLKLGA